jgi:hypothetical protein
MKATKIFIVLAATAAIFLAAIGAAYGYYISTQENVNANIPYKSNTNIDFWGWFGGCLGFRQLHQTYTYQYQLPSNNTAQPPPTCVPPQYPYQPQNPNQGYYPYGYGYGRGCCGW